MKKISSDGSIYEANRDLFTYEDRAEIPEEKKIYKSRELALAEIKKDEATILTRATKEKENYDRQKVAQAKKKRDAYDAAIARQNQFIERIHQYGPNAASLKDYSYDVAMYCRYNGPRCSTYQQMYRNLENSTNQANELRRQQEYNAHLNRNSSGGGAVQRTDGMAQQSRDRYNSAVKGAAEKERIRVRDEQWKKK